MNDKRAMLAHFLAALAYRTQKAVRGAPADFGDFAAGNLTRTPKELVCHMTSVVGYADTFFTGGTFWPEPLATLDEEVVRFHSTIERLSKHISDGDAFLDMMTEEKMLQGPLADAMTHAGQLAMLRRIHGTPVPPENFIYADIDPANLTTDQPEPVRPDEEWKERL
ncbi:MAG: hypothetical protein IPM50_06220 [Acidobacteriota bacterium]|nr:MAG: hypothetical protein IPM50_06220 [Acidobacteriota bacterium]